MSTNFRVYRSDAWWNTCCSVKYSFNVLQESSPLSVGLPLKKKRKRNELKIASYGTKLHYERVQLSHCVPVLQVLQCTNYGYEPSQCKHCRKRLLSWEQFRVSLQKQAMGPQRPTNTQPPYGPPALPTSSSGRTPRVPRRVLLCWPPAAQDAPRFSLTKKRETGSVRIQPGAVELPPSSAFYLYVALKVYIVSIKVKVLNYTTIALLTTTLRSSTSEHCHSLTRRGPPPLWKVQKCYPRSW